MKWQLLTPWKVARDSCFFPAIDTYWSRLGKVRSVEWTCPKGSLSSSDAEEAYLKAEIQKLPQPSLCVFLDEGGEPMDSGAFAQLLQHHEDTGTKTAAFVLGGAWGLTEGLVLPPRRKILSLSSLTMAHELALSVLVEQLYRAHCIQVRHPYHHGEVSSFFKAHGRTRK